MVSLVFLLDGGVLGSLLQFVNGQRGGLLGGLREGDTCSSASLSGWVSF